MKRDLIIDYGQEETTYAVIEEKRLVKYRTYKTKSNFEIGDIFLGKVKKISPQINAAFIDISYKKNGFLHFSDLPNEFNVFLEYQQKFLASPKEISDRKYSKDGSIDTVLKNGDTILVQISKEPISTKGHKVRASISLPGYYVVLIPFSNSVAISQKIRSREERQRLLRLAKSIKPEGFGVIVRTAAIDKKSIELFEDVHSLLKIWKESLDNLSKIKVPGKALGNLGKLSSHLKGIIKMKCDGIHVNDPRLFVDIKEELIELGDEREKCLKMHKTSTPILEKHGVNAQVKKLFGKVVNIEERGYLVLEHTEALHVIDVNSGVNLKSTNSPEEYALKTNLRAATEIARQLRLREMGGIIVIDFIDMASAKNRKTLFTEMIKLMKPDIAKHKVLPLSEFCLMEITRERVRSQTEINVSDTKGKKYRDELSSLQVVENILNKTLAISIEKKKKVITVSVHPFLKAYLVSGIFSKRIRFFLKHKVFLKIKSNNSFHISQFSFSQKS